MSGRDDAGDFWAKGGYRRQSAQEALADDLRFARDENGGRLSPERRVAVVARHQVQRDAGSFADFIPAPAIDDAGRDQLLANAREDAAHALSLCLLMARRQRWMLRIGWGALGLLAYIAWRVS